MPLSEAERKKCVETLLNAEKEKKQAIQLSVTYPHITIEDSYAHATEYVIPAMEIVDARIVNPRKIFDTVADNGAAAGIVVGGRPIGPMEMDLRWAGGIMYRNSEIEETGLAAGVLGHPALGVAWL